MLKVNAHIHTPYSFSSFSSVEEAVAMAKREDIGILGVNDFFTTEAYEEFERQCRQAKIYPLFNIEFIGVDKTFKKKRSEQCRADLFLRKGIEFSRFNVGTFRVRDAPRAARQQRACENDDCQVQPIFQ